MTTSTELWQSRIISHGEEDPGRLMQNPSNWRVHGARQKKVLEQILDEVGWVRHVIINQRTGHIVDGHLRVQLAQARDEPSIPVVYVDLDEQEERLILASLDPIASLAATDSGALMALAASVNPDDQPEVAGLVRELAGMHEQKRSSPKQDQIDRRADEFEQMFTGVSQRSFECTCPECGHEFAFAR
jgi:hypothetical protein